MLTKKDLLEAIEDIPMDAEIVPHERPNEHRMLNLMCLMTAQKIK